MSRDFTYVCPSPIRLVSSGLVSSGLPPDPPLPTRFRQPAEVEDHGIRIMSCHSNHTCIHFLA